MISRSLDAVAGVLSFCIILSVAWPPAAGAAAQSCLECHKKIVSKRVVHPAISQFVKMEQGCSSCHQSPHGTQKASKSLSGTVPALCFQCHDKGKFTKIVKHQPVASGDCMLCHNPHSSDVPSLLSQPVPYLCHTCHEDKKDGAHILGGYGFGEKHPVQGRKDPLRSRRELGCVSCHNPHSSSREHLFTNESAGQENLCYLCHRRVIVRP